MFCNIERIQRFHPTLLMLFFFLTITSLQEKNYLHWLQSRISMPIIVYDVVSERWNKPQQWLFLPVLHYSELEYFVEILHWTGSLTLPPEGIANALIYMLKKDLCSTRTMASKIVAALQYKRCIALRECSAVNLMTSVTFSNEMRKILRPMHCPLSLQTQSCRCLGESSSCTYIQQLRSDTKDGFEDQTRLTTQCQISTSFRLRAVVWQQHTSKIFPEFIIRNIKSKNRFLCAVVHNFKG